jgi:pyruvate-formate lyase
LKGSGAIPYLIQHYAGQADDQGIDALIEQQQALFNALEKEHHEEVEALAAATKKAALEAESLKVRAALSRKREYRANRKARNKARKLAKAKKRLS